MKRPRIPYSTNKNKPLTTGDAAALYMPLGAGLGDLANVDAPAPADKQILTYNYATSTWEPKDAQGIDKTGYSDGQVPTYNAANNDFEPGDAGKTYQPGTGISITDPDTSTPTISSTLGSIAVTDDVADYASLPTTLTAADAGQYWVTRDTNMAYRWSGTAWPAEGDGVAIGAGGEAWNEPTATSDPHWDSVVSLLNFDGSRFGFRDQKRTDRVWRPSGNGCDLSFTDNKTDAASAWFDSAYLTTDIGADWNFGSGAWTIEAWVRLKFSNTDGHQGIFGIGDGVSGLAIYRSDSSNQLIAQSINASLNIVTGVDLHDDAWTHIEVSCDGSTAWFFKDGIVIASESAVTIPDAVVVEIGNQPGYTSNGPALLNGRMQSFRVTKGVARHTADFTPSTDPLPNH